MIEKLRELIESDNIVNMKLATVLVASGTRREKFQVLYMLKKRHPLLKGDCSCHNSIQEIHELVKEFIINELEDDSFKIRRKFAWWEMDDLIWINEYVEGSDIVYMKQRPGCSECA